MSSVSGARIVEKKIIYVVIPGYDMNVVFDWSEKRFWKNNRNVVVTCSVNMFTVILF
jgi:hypothetical protein